MKPTTQIAAEAANMIVHVYKDHPGTFSEQTLVLEYLVLTAIQHATEEGAKEKIAPVQGYAAGIPWSMHLRAYDVYCKRYGAQEAMITGWCRGGFAVPELDMFIPGWREELSEVEKLKAQLRDLTNQLAARDAELTAMRGLLERAVLHVPYSGTPRLLHDAIRAHLATERKEDK
jgi:hypothetical protein